MITSDCITITPSTTSKTILIRVFFSPSHVDMGYDTACYVVGSLEGEDAFPDLHPGMFEFSDNGNNPYFMEDESWRTAHP